MKQKKSIQTIGENDIIPFGKYQGITLAEVYMQDPLYVHQMMEHSAGYRIELGTHYGWNYIFDEEDCAPEDGIYVLACMYDNHTEFEIYRLKKGERFKGLYEGENSHTDGWWTISCMAYHYIPDYCSKKSKHWNNVGNQGYFIETQSFCINIFAIQANGEMEYALSNQAWKLSSEQTYEELQYSEVEYLKHIDTEEKKYKITDSNMDVQQIDHTDVKAVLIIPGYSWEMHDYYCNEDWKRNRPIRRLIRFIRKMIIPRK